MGAIVPQVITEDRAGGAQIIDGSLRFDSSKSHYLTRTPSSAGNRRTFTWSGWIKNGRINTSAEQTFWGAGPNQSGGTADSNTLLGIFYNGAAQINVGSAVYAWKETTAYQRDYSGWYHYVLSVDTTASTAATRLKLWINNVQQTFSTDRDLYSAADTAINNTTAHNIGRNVSSSSRYFDGEMSQFYFIDGQALDPSYFGFTDPLTNTWRPKKFSGSILYQFTGTTVANATGAKPILNTTDDVGEVLGSGVASDSFASSLQFAIPGGTSSGINLTDQNPTGRVSGLRNITNGGSLAGNTSIYKYYGGSLYITGGATGSFSTDVWNSIGSGQFTVEMWIYLSSTSMTEGYGSTVISSRGGGDNSNGWYAVGFSGQPGNVPSLRMNLQGGIDHFISNDGTAAQFPSGQWTHIAQTKDASNVVRTYRNGIKIAQGTSSQALNNVNRGLIGGHDYESFGSFQSFYLNDIRIYNTAKYTGDSFTVPSNTFINRNSFYLPFDGNSPIGQDLSGNNNNWTPVNFGGSNTIEKATGALPILNTDGGGKVARVGVRTDSNASSLVLALPLVGIKSDFSNAINSGTSNKVVTTVGNAAASNSSSMFYGGSFYFDGNADCVDVSASSDFAFGTGDFTVECWVNTSTYSTDTVYRRIFMTDGPTGNASGNFQLIIDISAGALYLWSNTGDLDYITSGIVANGNWNHIAACRSGSTLRAFVNGIQVGSTTYSGSISPNGGTPRPRIGNYDGSGGSGDFNGYIQDFRIYKGLAKYTQNFIPASTDPDILPDTPSGVAYSSNVTAITDGAVTFDGTRDYMTVASSNDFEFGSGDFTVEFFTYINSHPGSTTWISRDMWDGGAGGAPWVIYYYNGTINFSVTQTAGSWAISGAGQLLLSSKVWNHVALVRNGNSFDLYVNGIKGTTGTFSGSIEATSNPLVIGGYSDGSLGNVDGFISNLHIVKGTALYTSNFTPPTGSISSVANTKLLCCKSNSSVIFGDITPTTTDNYSAGVALTATTYTDIGGSNCTITNNGSVTSSSAGTNSFGLTDAADITGTQRVDINMGNVSSTFFQSAWTLEMFFKTSNTGDGNWFVGTAQDGSTWQTGWSMQYQSGSLQWNYDSPGGGSQKSLGIALSSNTWYFMRVQRTPGSSTALNVWVYSSPTTLVGSFSGSVTDTSTQSQNTLKIGDANGNSNNLTANWQFANVMLTAGAVAYQNVPTLSSGVRTDNASVQTQLIPSGNVVATNFNPFTVNINTVRGQESGYATLNPLETGSSVTLSNGNLDVVGTSSWRWSKGTVAVSSGKWYWEVIHTNGGADNLFAGITKTNFRNFTYDLTHAYSDSYNVWGYTSYNGWKEGQGSGTSYGATFQAAGDVVGVALDMNAGTLTFYKNGVSQGQAFSGITGDVCPAWGGTGSSISAANLNFGQKPFKFPPPAGFQPLALANTPRPTIVRPDQYVGVSTYTGNGGTQSINVGFKPDLIWIKNRDSGSYGHRLVDSVRGASLFLMSHSTGSESTATDGVTSFNSNGVSLGSNSDYNLNNNRHVAWAWKAGGNSNTYNINDVGYATASAAGLTAGTITPTGASVNTKSGFSIIKYNSGGSTGNYTISHGLAQTPKFIIHKSLGTSNWWVYHASVIDNLAKYLQLNSTNAVATNSANMWGGQFPDSSVLGVRVGDLIGTSTDAIMYAWAEIPGFSKFGSFTGSSDLPFIHTGFKPRWLLIKNAGASGDDWALLDSARNTYNEMNSKLWPNTSAVEATLSGNNSVDFLANGFKMRSTNNATNSVGNTMIYAAFAEAPSFNLYGGQANAR